MATTREEQLADLDAIRAVNRAAFETDAESRLVDLLRADGSMITSLVAVVDEHVVGHIAFSKLIIRADNDEVIEAVALAPMAVAPEHQRSGIGTQLVRDGLDQCRARGHRIVIVVGHPSYYPRFGFSAEVAKNLRSPYQGEAFMALELEPGALDGVVGRVEYSEAFGSVA